MLDALDPAPATVLGRRWDVLAWNRGADALYDYSSAPKRERNLVWRLFRNPAHRRCMADPELLKQCLLILLDNAVKFTPAEGVIRIGLHREGGSWNCRVSDSGIGIPAAAQPHIFERFFRADNTHPTITGAGLGLAIAKSIAELTRFSLAPAGA